MTLLVVVAHPDDETFGCGSVLLGAAERGVRTVVLCATRGEAGEVDDDVDLPPAGIGALREAELREAAAAMGVTDVEVLDLHDSGMDGDPAPGMLCAADLDALAATVTDAVARHDAGVVVTLCGDDGHRDHLHVREAVRRAVAGTGLPTYVHCLPQSLMHEWILDRAGDDRSAAYVDLPDIGTPDHEVTTVLDAAAHYPARVAAIALHRSQHSPYDDLPEDLRRRFLSTDRLVRIEPPWTGGDVQRELDGW